MLTARASPQPDSSFATPAVTVPIPPQSARVHLPLHNHMHLRMGTHAYPRAELFLSKWKRFAGMIYYLLRLIDFIYLSVVLYQGFLINIDPESDMQSTAYVSLMLACILTTVEISAIVLWWRNESQYDLKSWSSFRHKLSALWSWIISFKTEMRLASYVASVTGCIVYLVSPKGVEHRDSSDEYLFLFYAIACYGHFRSLMQSLFVSPAFPTYGVHLITIEKMFANDVSTFLVFLFLYMFNYFTSMFITFPRMDKEQRLTALAAAANATPGTVVDSFEALAPFDDVLTALGAIYNMAIYGVRFATYLDRDTLELFSPLQALNFAVFFFHHSMFAIMCLTLLVRLLMAMMTNTFQSVKKSALLEWRLMIARAVLRHELLFFFADRTRKLAGERGADGKFYHSFLHVRSEPDGAVHVPLLLAQQRSASLFTEGDIELLTPGGEGETKSQYDDSMLPTITQFGARLSTVPLSSSTSGLQNDLVDRNSSRRSLGRAQTSTLQASLASGLCMPSTESLAPVAADTAPQKAPDVPLEEPLEETSVAPVAADIAPQKVADAPLVLQPPE